MHLVHIKWRNPRTKYQTKKQRAHPLKIQQDNEKKSFNSSKKAAGTSNESCKSNTQSRSLREAVDIDKSDEFILVHTSFLSRLLKNLARSVCVLHLYMVLV